MWTAIGARKGVVNMINPGEIERLKQQEKEHKWYLVEQFFNALADFEVKVLVGKRQGSGD